MAIGVANSYCHLKGGSRLINRIRWKLYLNTYFRQFLLYHLPHLSLPQTFANLLQSIRHLSSIADNDLDVLSRKHPAQHSDVGLLRQAKTVNQEEVLAAKRLRALL